MITPALMLDRCTDYVLQNAPRIQAHDPLFRVPGRRTVWQGLAFHALHGTLRVEWQRSEDRGQKSEVSPTSDLRSPTSFPGPAGLAIVWQDREEALRLREAGGKDMFRWQPTDPDGDCLYLALVIATAPGILSRLAGWFRLRFPPLPEYAHRRGKLIQHGWLNRLTFRHPQPLISHG